MITTLEATPLIEGQLQEEVGSDSVTGNVLHSNQQETPIDVPNEDDDGCQFQKKKRPKKSKVWSEFEEKIIKGVRKACCVHCNRGLCMLQSGSTTHLTRHLNSCALRKRHETQQQRINFPAANSTDTTSPPLVDGKFDMMRMREGLAHWILMHELPFSMVEQEGFNLFAKRGMIEWQKVSRTTIKKDCERVYEIEKKKLKVQLSQVSKISLTTDLWRSTNQKLGYMVLTGHFVDADWKLQKRVLNFVHVPPPHRGVEIADVIYKCLVDWGIENKRQYKFYYAVEIGSDIYTE